MLGNSDTSSVYARLLSFRFEANSYRESEYHIFGLLCEQKWSQVLAYFRGAHRSKWGTVKLGGGAPSADLIFGGGAVAKEGVVPSEAECEEDIQEILGIYCKILVERGESEEEE